jgi:hypothetical protein
MGIAVFSPPLDSHGNSVRGVEFCKRLLGACNFGVFTQIASGDATFKAGALTGPPRNVPSASAAVGPPAAGRKPPAGATTARGGGSRLTASSGGMQSPTSSTEVASGTPRAQQPSLPHPATGSGASVLGSDISSSATSAARRTTRSGQRIEKVRRIALALRRISRSWMLLRGWCGLPILPRDLEDLRAAAAADPEAPTELLVPTSDALVGGSRKSLLAKQPLPPPESIAPPPRSVSAGSISDAFSGLSIPMHRVQSFGADPLYSARNSRESAEEDALAATFPPNYERYKLYRVAVAASLAEGDGCRCEDSTRLLSVLSGGAAASCDDHTLVEAMKEELDASRRLVPIVALRLFLERSGLSVSAKAHPEAAAIVSTALCCSTICSCRI